MLFDTDSVHLLVQCVFRVIHFVMILQSCSELLTCKKCQIHLALVKQNQQFCFLVTYFIFCLIISPYSRMELVGKPPTPYPPKNPELNSLLENYILLIPNKDEQELSLIISVVSFNFDDVKKVSKIKCFFLAVPF